MQIYCFHSWRCPHTNFRIVKSSWNSKAFDSLFTFLALIFLSLQCKSITHVLLPWVVIFSFRFLWFYTANTFRLSVTTRTRKTLNYTTIILWCQRNTDSVQTKKDPEQREKENKTKRERERVRKRHTQHIHSTYWWIRARATTTYSVLSSTGITD